EALGALFDVANGMQVLIEFRTVVLAQAAAQRFGFVEARIEHAVPRAQPRALRLDAAGLLAEEAVENLAWIVFGRKRHAVSRKGKCRGIQRTPGAGADRKFQR